MKEQSIFEKYYLKYDLVDKYQKQPDGAVDVIIPIIHTNELWEANLHSIYREISVNRLLISDGGCIDDSLEIVKKFPRVEVLDHHNYISLGYCLRELILNVETEWFVYVHSDVYLPPHWYETMKTHQKEYDWFGCPQRITTMVEYHNVDKMHGETRPYAGSQMGKTKAFLAGIKDIDDDYVYRQEDYVLENIVKKNGFSTGKIEDTFHYHQVMHKDSPWSRKIKKVKVEVEWSDKERVRASMMQIKGIIKYLSPTPNLKKELLGNIIVLKRLNEFDEKDFISWVKLTNPEWIKFLNSIDIKFDLFLHTKAKKFVNLIRRKGTKK